MVNNNQHQYDVEPCNVYKILTGNHTFLIPSFQRDYVWATSLSETGKRHVNEFFEDIYEASKTNENYYIGSIITYQHGKSQLNYLVDGQQRLTTMMILLAAFRDYQIEDPAIGEEKYLVSDYLKFEQNLPGKKEQKNKLSIVNKSGQDYLDALISLQDINTETGEKNKYEDIPIRAGSVQMDAAYEYCKNFFSEIGFNESKHFVNYLLESVELSWINAADMNSAFIVFERMNDRGEDLLVSDKFKYLLFQESDEEDLEGSGSDINDTWERMKSDLKSYERAKKNPKFDRFISYFMVARFLEDKWYGHAQLYTWVKNPKNTKKIGLNKPEKFLEKMEADLQLHGNFLNGNNEDGTPNKHLMIIKSFASDVRQHIPILIAAKIGGVTKDEFMNLCSAIERLVFSLKLSGAQWNVINTKVPKWCTVLRTKKMSIDDFIKKVINPEVEDRKKDMSVNITDTSRINGKLIKYLLEKINEEVCLTAGEPITKPTEFGRKNQHTIEHILAQDFSKKDIEPDSDNLDTQKLVNRIGNLTLLERNNNAKLNNKTVEEKFEMQGYETSNIILSKTIQFEGFSGEMGTKQKKAWNLFEFEVMKLKKVNQGDKTRYYWTEKHVNAREKIYFNVLSKIFQVKLKPVVE